MALAFQGTIVRQLATGNRVGLGGRGIVDMWDGYAGSPRQQRREAQRDTPPAQFGQSHCSQCASGTGRPNLQRSRRIDRDEQVTIPLERVPRQIEMSVDDQHLAPPDSRIDGTLKGTSRGMR